MKHFCSFSEAIREGSKTTPAGTPCRWIDVNGGTCAIGAGAVAIGLDPLREDYEALKDLYPYLETMVSCPECGDEESRLYQAVYCLFDKHKWAREAIADWLESEEEKLGFETLIESESSSLSLQSVSV